MHTASEFHNDNSRIKLLIGSVGCGKSVACIMDILLRSMQQEAGKDGIRRTRWAVIRNTYPELKSTTIKTWRAWFPDEKFGKIRFDSPINQLIKFNDVEIEVIFLALDGPNDVGKLMSLELTGIYINELQFINASVFSVCELRINRYPAKKDGASITWTGIIADTNPPDTDHWIYRRFEEEKPKGYKVFHYEPPLLKLDEEPKNDKYYEVSLDGSFYINNDQADYIKIQPDKNYWINLVPSRKDEEIKVNILGQYGVVMTGKPVHKTYNDNYHYIDKELLADENLDIGFGWDFGLSPAIAIVQLTPRGRLIGLDELWTEDMDLRDFSTNIVIPHLDKYYPFWRQKYVSRHDPAGQSGSQTDGKTCQDILREAGIISLPAADNNSPTARRDGLKYFLSRMASGLPAFTLSNKCKMIRKGLIGGFQYARVKVGGDERFHEKPVKNIYSHSCEALEYIAMHYAPESKKPSMPDKKAWSIQTGNFMGR